jgi:UPF0755 protein
MMEWEDPYALDEAGQERERRRAEREQRRRGRQESLGEKVGDQQPDAQLEPEPEPEPELEPALAAAPPPRRPAASVTATPPPRGPSHDTLRARRLLGLGAVVVALVLVFFAGKAVKDLLSGGDPAPAPAAKPLKTQELTIPEGMDRHQIADLARKAGIKGDYEKASKSFKGFDPAKYGAEDPPNLEGFLFPALYELPKEATVKDLIAKQLSEGFKAHLAEVDLSYAESKNLNVYDVLKIASMIEREIQVPAERKLAAAVIYNRLKAGTPLGIDATIRYEDQNYDEQLLESRLSTDTPYNTRTHSGLPPTPIGNPGLASIKAAANPAKSDAFFFVVKPGTCGEHVFVETQAEFDQAEAAYQQALQEQGGSPTEC